MSALIEKVASFFRVPTKLIHETDLHLYFVDRNNNILMVRK